MRILHIVNHIRRDGNGVTNVVVDLACLQAEAGNHVLLVAARGEYQELLQAYGVTHVELEHTALKKNPIKFLKAAIHYQRILREFQPDIVHAHMIPGMVLAKLLRIGSKYKLVSTVHSEFQKGAWVMGLADRVIAVSQAVAQAIVLRGFPSHKVTTVLNGTLGSPRMRSLDQYSKANLQHPAITTVAGMAERKGITELIEAFERISKKFPDAHLYLVGDGPDRAKFEAEARKTSAFDRVHFEGFQLEPQKYLLATDIFVLASHREPYGLVISEAREVGCAIVASRVDGIPEALDNGQAGLLVAPRNSEALASALEKLLSDSVSLRYWRGKAKQNLEGLKVARVCGETLAVYHGLLGSADCGSASEGSLKAL
ncbi:glycosyltransferase [Gloeobacter violaceus]|uniref:Glr0475 protein n=1 Tax=Gloeobacter violaceus (strain ATCC 29082 / PCC 7421) TaxID=251221 RepID=Q7NND6_GLOVI|nr:glycosyltransferase [Gloeobacter violaceus]BAC88416.1 glr0475 [Gloeobacter violaceus PCC 7421]